MKRSQNFVQAYRQAPWRKQLQLIGLFLASVVLVAVVAGIYLNVSARAGEAGRQIQVMYSEIQVAQQINEDKESQLAQLTSASTMEKRARELGFAPVDKDLVLYLDVPEYQGRPSVALAPPPGGVSASEPTLPYEYTSSLFDWAGQVFGVLARELGISATSGSR